MKSHIAALLSFGLMLALPKAARSESYTNAYGVWTYTTNANSTCTLTGYSGPGGVVTLPSTISGLTVASIGFSAFSDGDLAKSGLTVITIPESVTSIAGFAFSNCSSLIAAFLPGSVTNIGGWAFAYCPKLMALVVNPRNPVYCDVDGVLMNQSQTALIQYPAAVAGSYTIPSSITNVGEAAFGGATGLTSVAVGPKVLSIASTSFADCTGLNVIAVDPANPAYSSLAGVLFNRSKTTLVLYPTGAAGGYVIPAGVTNVADDAFSYCKTLTSVTMPDSLTTIGDSAFYTCSGLTNATIGPGVTSIGAAAFANCTSLKALTIPPGLRSIGNSGFAGCSGLATVNVGSGVANIGQWAFAFCTSLTNLILGPNVSSIGALAFNGCSGLRSITFPSSLASIGDSAFIGCMGLTNVYFWGNAPGVGSGVFAGIYPPAVYYLPGTTGWASFSTNTGLPTALWLLPNPLVLLNSSSFGVRTNQFGFIISWATNRPVAVEACTNLANASWSSIGTNTLTGGSSYFRDPKWTNYNRRFYRLRSL
jgi:hypothetical protein